tara:strand:- start:555 stop:878 length:324 start_codon:yes stop_codon:yes gene_type:complete
MATPRHFSPNRIWQIGGEDKTLFTLQRNRFRTAWGGPGPEDGNEHQANSRHPGKNIGSLQAWCNGFSGAGVKDGKPQNKNTCEQTPLVGSQHVLQLMSSQINALLLK